MWLRNLTGVRMKRWSTRSKSMAVRIRSSVHMPMNRESLPDVFCLRSCIGYIRGLQGVKLHSCRRAVCTVTLAPKRTESNISKKLLLQKIEQYKLFLPRMQEVHRKVHRTSFFAAILVSFVLRLLHRKSIIIKSHQVV